MSKPVGSTSIKDLATSVYDNGRRGSPKPGCDCLQCFGYCIVDQEVAERELFARADRAEQETVLPGHRDDASDAPVVSRGRRR